jgi:hypothetical protein
MDDEFFNVTNSVATSVGDPDPVEFRCLVPGPVPNLKFRRKKLAYLEIHYLHVNF